MAAAQDTDAAPTRTRRRPADKYDERRAKLATAALETLAELGYARTSLREIAQKTKFSHGVLHYYFADKVELITHCVKQYKAECVRRYDEIAVAAQTADELRDGFAAGLAQTMREDASMHRLWYDLRGQSMFDLDYRDEVTAIDNSLQTMVWRILSKYAALAGREIAPPPSAAYAVLDGLFQQALLRHLYGDELAGEALVAAVVDLLPTLLREG